MFFNDPTRRMSDRILNDFSNLRTVVEQFRNLGHSDTYILETIMAFADIINDHQLEHDFEELCRDLNTFF